MITLAIVTIGLFGCSHAGPEHGPAPTQATETPALPDALWQHWVHSFEDDAPGFRAFRPRSYAFPPARGREGFLLDRDGRYVEYAIARGDGNAEAAGTWKRVGKDTLQVKAAGHAAERLRILSVEDGLLKLRDDP